MPFTGLANPYDIVHTGPAKTTIIKDSVSTNTKNNGIDLAVKSGRVTQLSSGTVVDGEKSSIVFQELTNGAHRALIHISEAKAPTSYEFKIIGAARLKLNEEGSVDAYDAKDNIIAVIKKPWAKDKNNQEIPTFFTIENTTLTQVVEHTNNTYTYGITADPFWVPAWVAIRACMAHPVCREVAKQGTKAAIKWAMEHLF